MSLKYDVAEVRRSVESQLDQCTKMITMKSMQEIVDFSRNFYGPEMYLIHWRTLRDTGYLPRFDECMRRGLTKTYADVVKQYGTSCTINFFSHRWLRPSKDPKTAHPDDERGTKAKVVAALGERIQLYNENRGGHFFWIDYCCVDQDDPLPGVMKLPVFIALCMKIWCYVDTPDYMDRAWTRLERVVMASTKFIAGLNYVHVGSLDGTGHIDGEREEGLVPNPLTGSLTDPVDLDALKILSGYCQKLWSQSYNIGNSYAPIQQNRIMREELRLMTSQLQLDSTKVAVRWWSINVKN